ncbi:MAG: hypothetical protein J0L92_01585 [Deltaproteobacteria bacterium]|nr:hypothetical protein [Deltaproteobacteria bacterium]
MRRKHLAVVLALSGLIPAAHVPEALAQEVRTSAPTSSNPHPLTEYGGVTPGGPNQPPAMGRIARRRGRAARATIVTWPGFQMLPGGGSRFFVQTNSAVAARLATSEGRVEIVFPNTAIHLGNSRRYLETQYFETPVVRAHLERRRNDMVLVMQMRANVVPQISTGAEGTFTFTYIDFAAGQYRPADLGPVAPPPRSDSSGQAQVRPASPDSQRDYPSDSEMRSMDEERPPPTRGPTQ